MDRTLSDATIPNQGAMTMKEYSAFPKASGLEPQYWIGLCHIQDPYFSVEIQLVYLTAPVDKAK